MIFEKFVKIAPFSQRPHRALWIFLCVNALVALGVVALQSVGGGRGVSSVPLGDLWYLPIVLDVLLLVYALFLRSSGRLGHAPSLRFIVAGTILLSLPWMLTPPIASTDLYANAYHGRLVSVHGENPFTVSRDAAVHDIYFDATHAAAPYQTTYGPLWMSSAALLTSISGEHVMLTVTLFRLLNFCALLAIILLLYSSLQNVASRWTIIFVAWNPLILFEGIQNGHNDLLMALVVLAALLAYQKRRDSFILPLLVLGGLIKYVAWILLPLAILALVRRERPGRETTGIVLRGVIVGAALLVLAFAPYWEGAATFRQLFALGQFFALPFYHPLAVLSVLFELFGQSVQHARELAHTLGVAMFIVIVLWSARRLYRKQWGLVSAGFVALTAFLFFGISYFQPWYLLWLLPLVPLLRERWQTPAFLVLTLLPLATYPLFLPL